MKGKENNTMDARTLYRAMGEIDERWITRADDDAVWARLAAAQRRQHVETRARHLVLCELKKLLGVRYLWVFLVVMLLLNSVVAWVTADQSAAAGEPADMIVSFMDGYFADPAPYEAHYAQMRAFDEVQDALWLEAMRAGNYDFVPEQLPDRYSTDPNFSDAKLYAALHAAIAAAQDYPATIDGVLHSARANLGEFDAMGIAQDSFSYRYQLRVIELYARARDSVRIGIEHTRGWGEYFAYDTVNIFLLLMLLMLGATVFAQERTSGFLPILRTARHGRARTARAKLWAALLVGSMFVVLFTISTWAVFGLRLGYSSPHNAIQVLDAFTLSPYRISIGQYFAITLGVRLLACMLFCAAVLALSTLLGNDVVIYLAGLAFGGLQVLLSFLPGGGAFAPLKYLNIISAAAVDPLFVRYRALPLFGEVVGYVPTMLCLFVLLTAALCVLAARMYVRGMRTVRPAAIDRAAAAVMTACARLRAVWHGRTRRAAYRPRRYSLSLTAAEAFKLLISSRALVIVLALLCLKVGYAVQTYENQGTFSDHVYAEYMTVLEGPLHEEKLTYLREERANINNILARRETMHAAYVAEEITFDEYRTYLSDYNDAYARDELLVIVEERAAYLVDVRERTGEVGWFLYDTGWRQLYDSDADLFLYAAILLLLTGIFASEYVSRSSSGGFAHILRATKHGRRRTFAAKLLAAGMVTAVLSVLTATVDVLTVFVCYDMPAADAPLWSMPLFAQMSADMTVGQYLWMFVLLRVVGALLLAMLVCALSELLCKYIPVLGSSIVLTLLPALCAAFGLAAAERVNYLNLLAGTPLVLQSATLSLFGSDFAMLALWIAAFGAAVVAALASARRVFVK